jgi:hypothetical protein
MWECADVQLCGLNESISQFADLEFIGLLKKKFRKWLAR